MKNWKYCGGNKCQDLGRRRDDTVTVDSNDNNVRYINVDVYPNFSDELIVNYY